MMDVKKGYVSMANNKFASDNYKHRSSIQQAVTGRSFMIDKLIREKIDKKEKFDFQDVIQMHLNQQDGFLCEVLPKVLDKLVFYRHVWSNPKTEILFDSLNGWNCNMTKNSVPASIYHVWEHLFH